MCFPFYPEFIFLLIFVFRIDSSIRKTDPSVKDIEAGLQVYIAPEADFSA